MIIHSTKDDNKIPHRKNIFDIANLNPIVQAVKPLNPIIAGGYATALFCAPRYGKPPGLIYNRYYHDVDIYPDSQEHREKIMNAIEDAFDQEPAGRTILNRHVTERATTYKIKIIKSPAKGRRKVAGRWLKPEPEKFSIVTAQVMNIPELEGSVEQVFSTYDFTICCVAFRPQTQDIWYHQDIPRTHAAKRLELYKPKMLEIDTDPDEIILQLLRIYKYVKRWDYKLSETTLLRLLTIYEENPEIYLSKDKVYKMDSGGSGGMLSDCTANIWKLMGHVIKSTPGWRNNLDPFGLISGVKPAHERLIDVDSIFKQLNT